MRPALERLLVSCSKLTAAMKGPEPPLFLTTRVGTQGPSPFPPWLCHPREPRRLLRAPLHLAGRRQKREKPGELSSRCSEEVARVTCYWPEPDHVTGSNCKGAWEMESRCVPREKRAGLGTSWPSVLQAKSKIIHQPVQWSLWTISTCTPTPFPWFVLAC